MRLVFRLFISFFLVPTVTLLCEAQQQSPTSESLLDTGLTSGSTTYVGGYGNAIYQHDRNAGTARMNLERFVIFLGHRFSGRISFFSELEIEDAKVEGGKPGGEIALEQAYVKFDLSRDVYLVAGLFLPRIGIINEDHLPNRFNGNERPLVETFIIPSTWRELGIGLYGTLGRLPLNYSFALVNGLNSADFQHGTGIREGRFEGRNATANNLAITGALQYQPGSLQLQISGYAGGTVGLPASAADTLHLSSGIFGTPVLIGEAHARYERGGLQVKLLGTIGSIPDAAAINDAFANNTPQRMYGAYAEVGYDILSGLRTEPDDPQLVAFARLEKFDLNAKVPTNGIKDETLNQTHLIAGFTYLPLPNVVVKADIRLSRTGNESSPTPASPEANDVPYEPRNAFLNLGIGFSF